MHSRNHHAQRWQRAHRTPSSRSGGEGTLTRLHTQRALAHERWLPQLGASYFLILGDSTIKRFQWQGTDFDHEAWQFGNCFRVWKEAEQARDKIKEVLLMVHQDSP